jgi:transposase-like protein
MNLTQISALTEEAAREKLESIRWANGVVCPHCGRVDGHTKLQGKKHRPGVWKCNNGCAKQFSVTVGTVMEGSHLPIRTWLMAFAILCSSKKGVSALQLQRQLGLGSYRTAWHLCHRIRYRDLAGIGFNHGAVNHAKEVWVDGITHTNGIEGHWGQLKRSIKGTHIHVSSKHLWKYVSEFSYRRNNRGNHYAMFARLVASLSQPRLADA